MTLEDIWSIVLSALYNLSVTLFPILVLAFFLFFIFDIVSDRKAKKIRKNLKRSRRI